MPACFYLALSIYHLQTDTGQRRERGIEREMERERGILLTLSLEMDRHLPLVGRERNPPCAMLS